MIKGIIFDYDGVIGDTIEAKAEAFCELYAQYGQDICAKVKKHHRSNGGMSRFKKIKYYHKFYLDKDLNENELNLLADNFSHIVIEKVINSPFIEGALEYIKLKKNDKKLFISTATPENEIKKILKIKNIYEYFTNIYGSPNEKTEHIDDIMKSYDIKCNELIFFGDSYSDYDASNKRRIKFILLKNKYNLNLKNNYNLNSIQNFKEQI